MSQAVGAAPNNSPLNIPAAQQGQQGQQGQQQSTITSVSTNSTNSQSNVPLPQPANNVITNPPLVQASSASTSNKAMDIINNGRMQDRMDGRKPTPSTGSLGAAKSLYYPGTKTPVQ